MRRPLQCEAEHQAGKARCESATTAIAVNDKTIKVGRPAGQHLGKYPWARGGRAENTLERVGCDFRGGFSRFFATRAFRHGRFLFCSRKVGKVQECSGKKNKEREVKMKNTNTKLLRALSFALVLAVIFVSLVSCAGAVDPVGTATVVVSASESDTREYSVPLSKVKGEEGAFSLLDYLKDKGELEYESENGPYGKKLIRVGSVVEDGAQGKYIYIWTSVEGDFDTSAYKLTLEYKGTTLVSSGVGISSMSVPDGAIIYISYYPD